MTPDWALPPPAPKRKSARRSRSSASGERQPWPCRLSLDRSPFAVASVDESQSLAAERRELEPLPETGDERPRFSDQLQDPLILERSSVRLRARPHLGHPDGVRVVRRATHDVELTLTVRLERLCGLDQKSGERVSLPWLRPEAAGEPETRRLMHTAYLTVTTSPSLRAVHDELNELLFDIDARPIGAPSLPFDVVECRITTPADFDLMGHVTRHAAYSLDVKLLSIRGRRRWLGLRRDVVLRVRGRPGGLKRFFEDVYAGLPDEESSWSLGDLADWDWDLPGP